jgi:hypothetical protein
MEILAVASRQTALTDHLSPITNHSFRLLPPDLTAFILFFQPALYRLEVLRHGAAGDIFAGRFL